ncbi:MAG: hypothetical protein KDB24_13935, partial [Microthrixaceae bacterium]|nr:hypothetical protein [Microthrixaceae bacterium]
MSRIRHDRFAWVVIAGGAVLVVAMWLAMTRSVAGFNAIEREFAGVAFDDARPVPGDPSAGGPWVQAGPGSWVSDAPGALRSVTGVAGQGTFA